MQTQLPTISIVTPSFNQGRFLERTLRSVLDQNYPHLEYVVMDGGSNDESCAIIEHYAPRLSHWESKRDNGQYDAIDRGFRHTTGEIMAWLNSDDMYMPWTFAVVGEIFARFPQVEWITAAYPSHWNSHDQLVFCETVDGYHPDSFRRGDNLPGRGRFARYWIQQESTFWRRSLWERAGGYIDPSFRLAGDFELWARLFQHADLHVVGAMLAGFRKHGTQKTAQALQAYMAEAAGVLQRHGGRPRGRLASRVRTRVRQVVGSQRLARLSPPMRLLLVRLGLIYPVGVCHWAGEAWQHSTRYII
ncbi:MAG: glycosyltransferase [Chloroflexaceae bacterium]|jgi:GT2 family glycosyltransferase|nr:glycosyltransferase [Chloroflexaceae bacterium]